jgi:hypothetical protein
MRIIEPTAPVGTAQVGGLPRHAIVGLICAAGAAGCVNVNAPAEPIVIELNVNIKQEVLYRLVESAEDNIQANPEIF